MFRKRGFRVHECAFEWDILEELAYFVIRVFDRFALRVGPFD